MADDPRIAILYSAPLVWRDEAGERHPVDSLDFETERSAIFESLAEAGRQVEVRVEPATADTLRTLTTLGYRVLHYSGHGHPDLLAFEDGRGGTHEINPDTLRQLFAAGRTGGVQLAFVSACHSRKAGEAFIEAGVPHVVAVRLETPVYDAAARTFARQFYLALASGKTVGDAFQIGRSSVHAMKGLPSAAYEAEKFLLLPEYGKHDIAVFADAARGRWRDVTPAEPPTNLPAEPEHFIGRSVDTQEVVEAVLDRRLVTVRGAPGIGKTALGIVCGHYLNQRRFFREGVFLVPLRGAQSGEAVRSAAAVAVGVEARDDTELIDALRARDCLLVLDNCEDPLHAAPGAFRRLVSQLLQQAPKIRLLLTSRQAVGGGLSGVAEKVCSLTRLAPLDAARLLVELAPRALTLAEIGARTNEEALEKLAGHPALEFLSGHPHAISLAAPLVQDKSLDQLHTLLEEQDVDALVADVPEEERDAVTSLAVSLGVSVECVRERDPAAVRLFGAMGLLPAGAFPYALDAIWGQGWRPHMDALVRASLVERAVWEDMERFSTFPFVTSYAARLLMPEDRRLFSVGAAQHFADLALVSYQTQSTADAHVGRAAVAVEEESFWACLDPERAVDAAADNSDMSAVGVLASFFSQLLLLVGRYQDATQAADLGVEMCRAVGDPIGEAQAQGSRGDAKRMLRDMDGAREAYSQALSLHRKTGDRLREARMLASLGLVKARTDDRVGARRDIETALKMFRQMNNPVGEGNCRAMLGRLWIEEGDPEAAIRELLAALEVDAQHNRFGLAGVLDSLAVASVSAGRCACAVVLSDEALRQYRIVSEPIGQAQTLRFQMAALFQLGKVEAAFAAGWHARGLLQSIRHPAADEMDSMLEEVASQLGAGAYDELVSALTTDADSPRGEAVAAIAEEVREDKLIQEVMHTLSRVREPQGGAG